MCSLPAASARKRTAARQAETIRAHIGNLLAMHQERGHVDVTSYDFTSLNDKEFEVFCADLLGANEGVRFERFKSGRDGGVDGRFFRDGREAILQCKHWPKARIEQLIRHLRDVEKPKIERLKPQRYILALSIPLSRHDKQVIYDLVIPPKSS